jgi:hypothetical protein
VISYSLGPHYVRKKYLWDWTLGRLFFLSRQGLSNLWNVCPKWHSESVTWHVAFAAVSLLFLLTCQLFYIVKNMCLYTHKLYMNYRCYQIELWSGDLSRYSDWLRAGRSGDRIQKGARFFAHVQTGPGAHPASCTMGTGCFLGVKRPGRGADQPPLPSAEVENE